MTPPATPNPYKRHRFPGEIISHAVWLCYRFSLSHRDVEELLFERGIIVSYEAIRKWCRKFGQDYQGFTAAEQSTLWLDNHLAKRGAHTSKHRDIHICDATVERT
jgi:putative transposase